MLKSVTGERSSRRRAVFALAFLLGAFDAPARLIPTAPVNAWPVLPAVQKRSARHVVALELVSYGASCMYCVPTLMRVAVHDSLGIEAPRDITPGNKPGYIASAAALEGADGSLRLLLYGGLDAVGNVTQSGNFLYSADGGLTWSVVAGLAGLQSYGWQAVADFGGPVAEGASSQVRLGNPSVPFVVSTQAGFWGVRADGSSYLLAPSWGGALLGSDIDGSKFLVAALLFSPPPPYYIPATWKVATLDLSGALQQLFELVPDFVPWIEGWIAPDGSAYLNVDWSQGGNNFYPTNPPQPLPSRFSVTLCRQGTVREIVSSDFRFAVLGAPSADFSGAWIVTTDSGATVLSSFTPSGGLLEAWRDESNPRLAALFAGDSGQRVLIQKRHLAQSAGNRQELEWALWNVGQGAPPAYDTVALNSWGPVTVVHLDVDAAASGAPIIVDGGSPQNIAGPSGPPPSSAAPSFFPTRGLVRASLLQQLVIPAVARAAGKGGSNWRTDVILRNPGPSPLQVTARLLANPAATSQPVDASLTLGPDTITILPDVLNSLFQLERGSGALLLIPEAGGSLGAASRSYTASGNGTYGMAVDAVDAVEGARPGFEQTFAAGLLGPGFRTNLVASDLSGQGSQLQVFPQSAGGVLGAPISVAAPPAGQAQIDDVASLTGTPASRTAAFRSTTTTGSGVPGLIAIDNATNDPTWFGPDAPPGELTIPAIVHAGGANGAQYRTDLFLYNPDAVSHAIYLGAIPWDGSSGGQAAGVSLAPGESRRVPDALFTLFGLSGVAQLHFWSAFPTGRVLVTSRAYTLLDDGSTYGTLLPPLEATQSATAGETLEILGPIGAQTSRTNLALVNLVSFLPANVNVQILDARGNILDSFDQAVAPGNGFQMNDFFRLRGLADGPGAALIRVSPSSGTIAAYATTIDNATNDPVYFAGNLAP
jgi:hypothetical protein